MAALPASGAGGGGTAGGGSGSGAAPSYQYSGSMDTYAALESAKRESPAAERNKQPILEVLRRILPPAAAPGGGAGGAHEQAQPAPAVLCVAEGSGQHVSHFAAALPHLAFQPSDLSGDLFGSIAAYCHGLRNVAPPLELDMAAPDWPLRLAAERPAAARPAALVCINMCHISPLAATQGLIRGAGQCLLPGGVLFVYGPFTVGGQHTADSNASFDATLRQRNPQWGYRDTSDMVAWAAREGLQHVETLAMPANNFSLVFRKP